MAVSPDEQKALNEVTRRDFDLTASQFRVLLALFCAQAEHGNAPVRARAIVDILVRVEGGAPSMTNELAELTRLGLLEQDKSKGPPYAWRISRRGAQRLLDGGVRRLAPAEEARAS